ncbi:zf-HC2 domain-containing protein [Radiobacillus sp. PE A8.2]|uniref:zf-HC2 domain-containing protein n=1 Tax=Radiobacillus sp. PE A8.2 TaxID=3380349 RepID=UPI00388F4BE8
MPCDTKIVESMHNYLDGDITKQEEQQLRLHLQSCPSCQQHFHELKKTVAMLESNSHIQAPVNFTKNVMANLPREKKRVSYMRWFRAHPVVIAAAIFFIFMFGSVLMEWDQDGQLTYSKGQGLVIQDDTVIVPEGVTVEGDLVVKNGDLKIDGSVDGNVVIINGQHLKASAGEISGDIKQVNQIFDYIWYNIKAIVKQVFTLGN